MTFDGPADPTILHRNHLRCTAFTSSFAGEPATMQLALEWGTTNHPDHSHTICTDSQSLLKASERRSRVTHHLRSLLNARLGVTTLLLIPGNRGLLGNELADTAAKTNRYNHKRPSRAHFYYIRKIPHPRDTYRSNNGKFAARGGDWFSRSSCVSMASISVTEESQIYT